MQCAICGKEITGKYLFSNVGFDLKPSTITVCSDKCANEAPHKFKFDGNAIQQWSRITEYYANVNNFGKGKLAELKDHNRVNV